jgi:hypothetical protein
MTQWTAEIERIIAQVERAAYQKGWNDALARVVNVARNPMPPEQQQSLPLQTANADDADTPITMIQMVKETIADRPGLRGADIVSAVHQRMPDKERKSIDRTARTAIMRLKKRGQIEPIGGKWFPAGASDHIMSKLGEM